MSWTEIFPTLTDEILDLYETKRSNQETREIGSWFAVETVYNKQESDHIVSTSLFWKPAYLEDKNFPPINREMMQNPEGFGLVSRFKNPWKHYVEPIISGAKILKIERPDITFRVYLANDLDFLIPELTEAGCEIHLMESSSIRHNPGAMWRFLAMEEDKLVTITDSDRTPNVIHDIKRTEMIAKSGLSFWRVPYFLGGDDPEVGSPGNYRTILACQFGSNSVLPMRVLCEAFVWSCINGAIGDQCRLGKRQIPIFGSQWPTFGFDEWFLNAAVFPRIAPEGIVTFVPWSAKSLNHWFGLDIEYCTWANSKSEMLFYGNPNIETSEATPRSQESSSDAP